MVQMEQAGKVNALIRDHVAGSPVPMSQLLHLGEIIAMNARLFPDKPGGRDLTRR